MIDKSSVRPSITSRMQPEPAATQIIRPWFVVESEMCLADPFPGAEDRLVELSWERTSDALSQSLTHGLATARTELLNDLQLLSSRCRLRAVRELVHACERLLRAQTADDTATRLRLVAATLDPRLPEFDRHIALNYAALLRDADGADVDIDEQGPNSVAAAFTVAAALLYQCSQPQQEVRLLGPRSDGCDGNSNTDLMSPSAAP